MLKEDNFKSKEEESLKEIIALNNEIKDSLIISDNSQAFCERVADIQLWVQDTLSLIKTYKANGDNEGKISLTDLEQIKQQEVKEMEMEKPKRRLRKLAKLSPKF